MTTDSFRTWLHKAIRIDDDVDWSPHMVDYGGFKERLKLFARRRARLKVLLEQSPDHRIAETSLQSLLIYLDSKGDSPSVNTPSQQNVTHQLTPLQEDLLITNYLNFDLQPTDSSDGEESQASLKVKRKTKRNALRKISNIEREDMTRFLAWEMDKVALFYLSQWQRLSNLWEQNADVGDELLELYHFCVVNIVTVRQTLIRYDAFARTFGGTPMSNYYMKKVLHHPTAFRKLLFHEELHAIADSYALSLSDVRLAAFEGQLRMFQDILASSKSAESIASTGHQPLTDSFIQSLRHWYLLGAFEDRLGLEPSYLTMRGQSLIDEITQLAEWRHNKHEIECKVLPKKQLSGMQVYHLTLNLLSGALYCMNYYIVEPSSTMYVNRLGAHDAMSGTLIGMMPLAAFLSSIPYSMWTNRSFRHPFIMSCCLLIAGNLIYSLADRFGSIKMALAGRFICGLGAPKCIIRRYMADTTPVALRTSVNAGFGMVVAVGSAMGPAMAVLLNQIEYMWATPVIGFIYFNGLTLPGFFMASLWITFTVIVLATFEEPDRDGLKEQKELEILSAVSGSPTSEEPDFNHVHDDLRTIFSGDAYGSYDEVDGSIFTLKLPRLSRWLHELKQFLDLITFPVRICLGLLFAKVFTIEALVSATSALTKNRYKWTVQQVGTLGFINGCLVIPFSILVGRLSMSYQDHVLMKFLVGLGCIGLALLIDVSDLLGTTPRTGYNAGSRWAVSPTRYIAGYFVSYISIQAFEGVIGSTLSKVIPTALASGTVNSGLLATLVDTSGRACGDLFISAMGYLNLRQLMDLLFIPSFIIILSCLLVIHRYKDLLSV